MLNELLARFGTNLYFIPAALICITVHEFSHGWAAYKLGDDTAKNMGRLSLNPIRHMDLIGFLMMVLVGFGWAKPVPVNPGRFENPKRDMAITALAGPLSNFILAFLCLIIYAILAVFTPENRVTNVIVLLFFYTAVLSINLGVFNLVPVPPLDGSKVLSVFLPDRIYASLLRYERYGMILLIILLYSGVLSRPLAFAREGILEFFLNIIGAVVNVFS
ncbi:site-2 protease family protein [Oscillospiraceae bacterium OttesenSCG-928-G22]|nr:site-2 protease family protein [Oscillospiraceae bacterium OttesenSCG-928-G22]